jgi:hypothetical protein
MGIEVGGIISLIILALDIWAIVNILGSGTSTGANVLGFLLVLILPVVGLIIWLVAGPRGRASAIEWRPGAAAKPLGCNVRRGTTAQGVAAAGACPPNMRGSDGGGQGGSPRMGVLNGSVGGGKGMPL